MEFFKLVGSMGSWTVWQWGFFGVFVIGFIGFSVSTYKNPLFSQSSQVENQVSRVFDVSGGSEVNVNGTTTVEGFDQYAKVDKTSKFNQNAKLDIKK